jgi:hypothetical protein
MGVEKRIDAYYERTGLLLRKGRKGVLKFRFGACVQDSKLNTERGGRRL